MKKIALLLIVALLLMAGQAIAKPVFDFDKGQGFVSKADIMSALKLSNAEYDPSKLTFVATFVVTATADCRLESLAEQMSYSASVTMVINQTPLLNYGVLLDGYSVSSEPGYIPHLGESCYGKNFKGTVTNIVQTGRIKTLELNGAPIYQELQ